MKASSGSPIAARAASMRSGRSSSFAASVRRRAVLGAEQRQPLARRRAPGAARARASSRGASRVRAATSARPRAGGGGQAAGAGRGSAPPARGGPGRADRCPARCRARGPRRSFARFPGSVPSSPSRRSCPCSSVKRASAVLAGAATGRHYRWPDPRPGHLQFGATWPRVRRPRAGLEPLMQASATWATSRRARSRSRASRRCSRAAT